MQYVLVVDQNRNPLDPCHPVRARKMLAAGHAAVFRRFPFTIILKDRTAEESVVHAHRVKLDPGSKTTGVALVRVVDNKVLWAGEIEHRGQMIVDALASRRALRRGRRARHTRYRPARFNNRRRGKGWLPPSLESRLSNIQTWVNRIIRYTPVFYFSMELVKFDTQIMENAEISGVEYQQGTLCGYEIREYLLEKWSRKCAYCGATDKPLEIEHINPRARFHDERVSNLTLACHKCNQEKGNRTAAEYGHPEIQAKARLPLKDAAAVNATRWELWRRLSAYHVPVECGTGGRTKYNRTRQDLPKEHWLDAACVGESGSSIFVPAGLDALHIKATGHGRRARCRVDKYGFPFAHAPKAKTFAGYQTGDMVKAIVPSGNFKGTHVGRIAIRFRPSFRLNGFDVHPKYLKRLHAADGYNYSLRKEIALPPHNYTARVCLRQS
jgi:5-methylcytosine-specific restriction endonuclease McrA